MVRTSGITLHVQLDTGLPIDAVENALKTLSCSDFWFPEIPI
jgi:hypothetical protein